MAVARPAAPPALWGVRSTTKGYHQVVRHEAMTTGFDEVLLDKAVTDLENFVRYSATVVRNNEQARGTLQEMARVLSNLEEPQRTRVQLKIVRVRRLMLHAYVQFTRSLTDIIEEDLDGT